MTSADLMRALALIGLLNLGLIIGIVMGAVMDAIGNRARRRRDYLRQRERVRREADEMRARYADEMVLREVAEAFETRGAP